MLTMVNRYPKSNSKQRTRGLMCFRLISSMGFAASETTNNDIASAVCKLKAIGSNPPREDESLDGSNNANSLRGAPEVDDSKVR
jgi:hypothetical protein